MHLIQLLLPAYRQDGHAFEKAMFDAVRGELAGRFGGVTAYLRSPAVGLWQDGDGDCVRDDVVLFEVMSAQLDRGWWRRYRKALEQRFAQEEILVRTSPVERL